MSLLHSFVQNNYRWFYITKYSIKNALSGVNMNIMYLFAGMLEIATYIYLYYINKSIDFSGVITQFILIRLYSSFVTNRWYYFISDLIYSSGMTRFLLFPSSYFLHQLFFSFGSRLVKNILMLFSHIIILVITINFVSGISISWNFFLLLLFVPIGFLLNFMVSSCVGHLAFFVKDRRDYISFAEVYYMFFGIMSGSIIPLSLLPNGYNWLQYTPIAYIAYQPTRLYYNPSFELFLEIFICSVSWTILMFGLNRLIYKLGLKRNEAVGL